MSSMRRPRLQPIVLALGSILLATKLITLGSALLFTPTRLSSQIVGSAQAAVPNSAADSQASKTVAAPATSSAASDPAEHTVESAPSSNPAPVSQAERQVLEALLARRQELDARERALADRAALVDAAEQRISERVAQLSALQSKLEGLELARRQRDEANWSGLVKVYELMKPRDAAGIFNDMEMGVLLEVVGRMKDAKLAPILAAMQPDRARLVTTQLAGQRSREVAPPSSQSGPG